MNKQKAIYAIIVAGGSGNRMNSSTPKQFMLLHKKPIILHTIEKFISFNPSINIIVVLPNDQVLYFRNLIDDYNFNFPIEIALGGKTRFHSVKNGLQKVTGKGIVFIHDAVRPLVAIKTIERCYTAVQQNGNAIPAVPIVNSIRKVVGDKSKAVNRNDYVSIQTPQTFLVNQIKTAYKQPYNNQFTDDASVYERIFPNINLVKGNVENIKITYPNDIITAESMFKNNFD